MALRLPAAVGAGLLRGTSLAGKIISAASRDLSVGVNRASQTVGLPTPEELDTFVGMRSEFPCLQTTPGPEPQYQKFAKGATVLHHCSPFSFRWGGILPELFIAYETFGTLNEDRDNAILLHSSLSTSSHARSTEKDPSVGWWEEFIGPGRPLDTNKFFFVCANNIGGCYGSSGPSTKNPKTGKPYAMTFPLLVVEDMVNALFLLLDHLGIEKCYAAVGSSLGGMQSLSAAVKFPERVERLVTISAGLRSHPSSIALRYLQRQAIMSDPNWNRGECYTPGGPFPLRGMKHARSLATVTYRSGPEWDLRFGRKRVTSDVPSMCPDFEIESYLDHQGHKFCNMYDPNSLMYLSKAMDLYDISDGLPSLNHALERIECPVLVIGVQSDLLFPVFQQQEIARRLRDAGNKSVTYYEIDAMYGHDTFLLDLTNIGAAVKGFLEIGNTF